MRYIFTTRINTTLKYVFILNKPDSPFKSNLTEARRCRQLAQPNGRTWPQRRPRHMPAAGDIFHIYPKLCVG